MDTDTAMTAVALITLAWTLEIMFGWPNWLYRRIRHPVVWFGSLIKIGDRVLNRKEWSHQARYIAGMISTVSLFGAATIIAWLIAKLLPPTGWAIAIEALVASSLIASRSLYTHVAAVAKPLMSNDFEKARNAVSMIVGRDPTQLDEAGIARASLESLAENTSDGVTAPLFWGALFGLPGLVAYKAINTLDSMIGHKNDRYAAFGGFAARLDDVANFIPARLTGVLIALTSFQPKALQTMFKDASKHRSPNAGWPEAAMAGGLGVRLSGPRIYDNHTTTDPWLNQEGRDPVASDIYAGLNLYRRALVLAFCGLAFTAIAMAFL